MKDENTTRFQNYLSGKTITVPFNNDFKLISKLGELLKPPLPFEMSVCFAPNPLISTAGRRFPGYKNFMEKNKKFQTKKFNKMLRRVFLMINLHGR